MCACAKMYLNYNYNFCVTSRLGNYFLGSIYLCRSRICANESHAVFHMPVFFAVKTAIGFKTSIEVYFVEKNSARMPQLLEVNKLRNKFEQNVFAKIAFSKIVPMSC